MRFLLRVSPKLLRKQGKGYLSSKHKRRGFLGGVGYEHRVLSKYLSLCTCNYPFYSAYKSLISVFPLLPRADKVPEVQYPHGLITE